MNKLFVVRVNILLLFFFTCFLPAYLPVLQASQKTDEGISRVEWCTEEELKEAKNYYDKAESLWSEEQLTATTHQLMLYGEAVNRCPNFISAREQIIWALTQAKQKKAAISQINILLKMDKNNIVGLIAKGFFLAQEQPDKALAHFEDLLANPDYALKRKLYNLEYGYDKLSSVAFSEMGLAYRMKGNYHKAIELYKKANVISKDPANSLKICIAYEKMGELTTSKSCFLDFIQDYPDHPLIALVQSRIEGYQTQ